MNFMQIYAIFISQERKNNHHQLSFTCVLTPSLWDIIKITGIHFLTLMRSAISCDLFVLLQTEPACQHVPRRGSKCILTSLYAAFCAASLSRGCIECLPCSGFWKQTTLVQQQPSIQLRGHQDMICPSEVLFILLQEPRSFQETILSSDVVVASYPPCLKTLRHHPPFLTLTPAPQDSELALPGALRQERIRESLFFSQGKSKKKGSEQRMTSRLKMLTLTLAL